MTGSTAAGTVSGLPVEETVRYLTRVLPPPPLEVLEVGAGDGAVALALAAMGYTVTALDESLDLPTGADVESEAVRWIESDFLLFDGKGVFDAILFTRSLHHLAPLDRALDRALEALRPGGLLAAEEFGYDRVNLPTARWFYDLESVLVAAGVLSQSEEPGNEGNPLGRWRREHAHDPPLATGHAILAAVRDRFELSPLEEAPYLYRYFCERMEESERGRRTAERILALEGRLIRERDLAAAGLRFTGKSKA
jgi:SAM-dependent methyltransferase